MTAAARNFVVVDDEPGPRELARHCLEAAGQRVTEVAHAEEALATISRLRPDAALLDIMMPGMDGLELLRRLRQRPELQGLKVIMLTGKAYDFDRRQAQTLGADGYIVKPIEVKSFAARVLAIIDGEFLLRFFGVRGTLPVPGPSSLRYGGHTACVSLRLPDERLLIFDAGTGIKALGDELLRQGQRRSEIHLLLSHPHWDHINALPFFAPLYIPGNEVEILGARHGEISVERLVAEQMNGIYFPITVREFGARIRYRDLEEGAHEVAGLKVQALLLHHPGRCLGYRVQAGERSICYITDHEIYPEAAARVESACARLLDFVRGADVLIMDSTYLDEDYPRFRDWGHSAVGPACALAAAARVQRLCLFHHDPGQDDEAIDRKLAAAQAHLAAAGFTGMCEAATEGASIALLAGARSCASA